MLIRPISDLHTEFTENSFKLDHLNTDSETTLVLAGDIGTGTDACKVIREWSNRFKYIIYVAGNHEFYGQIWEDMIINIRNELQDLNNVFFLEKEHIVLDGVSFFGGTFWTNASMERHNEWYVKKAMNDFKCIRRVHCKTGKIVKMDVQSYRYWFAETINEYRKWISNDFKGPRVVVSHHAPSFQSSLEHFNGSPLNSLYYFDANRFCKDLDKVQLWFHGHMHNSSDYLLHGGTRVIANPYGYSGYSTNNNFQQGLLVDTHS